MLIMCVIVEIVAVSTADYKEEKPAQAAHVVAIVISFFSLYTKEENDFILDNDCPADSRGAGRSIQALCGFGVAPSHPAAA